VNLMETFMEVSWIQVDQEAGTQWVAQGVAGLLMELGLPGC
jgi:hypothetical protein